MKNRIIALIVAVASISTLLAAAEVYSEPTVLMTSSEFKNFVSDLPKGSEAEALSSKTGHIIAENKGNWSLHFDAKILHTFAMERDFTLYEEAMTFSAVNDVKDVACAIIVATLDVELNAHQHLIDGWEQRTSDANLAEKFLGSQRSFVLPDEFYRDQNSFSGIERRYATGWKISFDSIGGFSNILEISLTKDHIQYIVCRSRYYLDKEDRSKIRQDVRNLITFSP